MKAVAVTLAVVFYLGAVGIAYAQGHHFWAFALLLGGAIVAAAEAHE